MENKIPETRKLINKRIQKKFPKIISDIYR